MNYSKSVLLFSLFSSVSIELFSSGLTNASVLSNNSVDTQVTIVGSARLKYSANLLELKKQIPFDLSSEKLKSITPTYIPSKQSQIAFNFPNLQPQVGVQNGILTVSLPISLFEGPINGILRANEGRTKDTDFNRIDVNNTRVSFVNGGFNVDGNWQVQHREYLGKFFGRKKYTPWTSISGSFTQAFNVSVGNGILSASAGKTDIRGASKWYGSIVDGILPYTGANKMVNAQVNDGLRQINGMNIQQLLVQSGSAQVSRVLGISQNEATQLINSHAGGINGNISGGSLNLAVKVR
jgi:hypothetical protein